LKNIKLVIFDLDGTLIDAYPAINQSFNYAMRQLGYPLQKASIIRRAVGWGDANLLKPFVGPKDLIKAVAVYRKHHKGALLKKSRLFASSKRLLRYLLAKGYKLAVASNRPTKFSWILIRHLGLEKCFDAVLCADKLKAGKPHPEILQRIMRKFSLGPEQTLYVGDMVIDAQAAARAKVKCIIVTTGSSSGAQIKKEKPYRIIQEIGSLCKIL